MNRRRLLMGVGSVALLGSAGAGAALWSMGSMRDYQDRAARIRAVLSGQPDLPELVRYATLAASGHNTQPWRFRLHSDRIDILPDVSRRTPAVDPDDHHLFVSLGCAAENLAIAAAATGRPGELTIDPADDAGATYRFSSGPPQSLALFDAIPKRQSTRLDYDGRPVPAADLDALREAASTPGVEMALITDRARIDRIRDLVLQGNGTQLADAAFVRELKHWIRFNARAAMMTGDGLFAAASGTPSLPTWLGNVMFDLVFTAAAENEKYARQMNSSAGVAVFVADRADREHWIKVGRACQRFALAATGLGLKLAFVNQPVEVPGLRPELAALIGAPDKRPDLVMRFGYGPSLPFSPRRPVEAVLA